MQYFSKLVVVSTLVCCSFSILAKTKLNQAAVKQRSIEALEVEEGNVSPDKEVSNKDYFNNENANKVNIKSYDWEGEIPESRLVVLKNLYGSIRSRNHLENKVYLHATYQEIGENFLVPDFSVAEKNGYLFIEVNYAQAILDQNNQLRGRTDVSILFPDDVSIYAETDSGLIKIDKTASHVEAITQSGDVKLTTTGLFSISTVSGEVALKLRGIKQIGQSKVMSETGNISAQIFNDMDVALVSKSGRQILFNGQDKAQEFELQNGAALSQVELLSQSGNIEINLIAPPELEYSVKPTQLDVDLRKLPKAKVWKPGDAIFDRVDKQREHSSEIQ